MNSNRLYSKAAQKMIKLALSDAAHYSQNVDAETAEQELYLRIAVF